MGPVRMVAAQLAPGDPAVPPESTAPAQPESETVSPPGPNQPLAGAFGRESSEPEEQYPVTALPTVSVAQRGQVVAAIAKDETISELFGGHQYNVVEVGSWTYEGDTLIGAIVRVRFVGPATLDGFWPVVDPSAASASLEGPGSYYSERLVSRRVMDVTVVDLLVDFDKDRVVGAVAVPT